MRFEIRQLIVGMTLVTIAGLALSGCTSDPLAKQYGSGSSQNYSSDAGRIAEFASAKRGPAVEFTGQLEDGSTVTPSNYAGKVLVVNFWYAGCAPCRAEAPDLEKIHQEFASRGVDFLGVNVRDQVATAEAFERTFGITYRSTIDANTGTMQLAFSGVVAPNAVPTTLVLDKHGRVSSRILGRLPDASVLRSLVTAVLAEKAP